MRILNICKALPRMVVFVWLASGSCMVAADAVATAVTRLPAVAPSPSDNPTTPEKVSLGKQLFFDPRLSGDNTMSCATCHIPSKGFADGLGTAKGAGGKVLSRNTPSLLNVAFYTSYFWDGRAGSLEEQALAPIRAADEMNQDINELVQELKSVPGYVQQFRSVFNAPISPDGIAKALAAFQRTLISRDSSFDRFLAGDTAALSDEAREGWHLFQDAGCVRCHNGLALSDSKFYRLGVGRRDRDRGRGGVTAEKKDLYAFRTPGLRDVAQTAPYMHDGSFETLQQVVEFYYRSTPAGPIDGLTIDFEPLNFRSFSEIGPILAFLEALTGKAPDVSPPQLP